MARNLPACGLIPLLYWLAPRFIATELHARAKIFFPGVHRDRPLDRAGGRGCAAGRARRTGIRAVLQFRRLATASASATAAPVWRRRRLVRGRPVHTLPAAAAAGTEAGGELFQGAAAGKA